MPALARLRRAAGVIALALLPASAHAQQCALPGNDGPGGTLTGVINTYYPATANANAGVTSIQVGTSSGAATPIAAGDLLLIIQMQDAQINTGNNGAYGDGVNGDPGSGLTNINSSGLYEFVRATGPVSGGSVPIFGEGGSNGLVNAYHNGNPSGSQGHRRFQVIRVPQYSSATVGTGLTALAWTGTVGGVLVFDVAGVLDFNGQTIDVSGAGFRAGGGRQLAGENGGNTDDYRDDATRDYHGSKGEGVVGAPRFPLTQATLTVTDIGVEGLPNGSAGRGAPGNAGGGGNDGNPDVNDQNSGGGGGGNGGTGGLGGNTWSSNLARGGFGGVAVAVTTSRIVLGGGGGAGSRNNSTGVQSSGGAGGGMVIIRTGSATGSGTVTADGVMGQEPANDGGGGGGGGGTVMIYSAGGGLGSLNVNARGAAGTNTDMVAGSNHGPGGGGGGGYVLMSSAASVSVASGSAGSTVTVGNHYGATDGTGGLSTSSLTASQIIGIDPSASCVPSLTVVKTTSTPTVTSGPSGTTATYTITVTNAAGRTAASTVTVVDTLASKFSYASTGTVTLGGGATRPSTSNPTVGDTIATWGTFTLPAGGSVAITFTVNVSSLAPSGTYQNPATARYLDPGRTVVNGTTTSTYNYAGSAGENVTVNVSDPSMDKRHTTGFTIGTNGTYTIVVRNLGNLATSGTLTVRDTLPSGLGFVSGAGTGWTVNFASGIVTATYAAAVPAGDSAKFTITVSVAAGAAPSVTNAATVSGGGQGNTANDRDTDPTAVSGVPDLTLDKRHTSAFTVGQNATYTLVARNIGTASTGAVTVLDTLPAGLSYVSGSGGGWSFSQSGQIITATHAAAVVAGDSSSFTLTVSVAAGAYPSVTNAATASTTGETDTSNNRDTDPTAITGVADATIDKRHTSAFTVGQNGIYTLVVQNSGTASTGAVTVRDTLPAGLSYVSGSGSGWSFFLSGQVVIVLHPAPIAAGDSASFTVTASVAAGAYPSVTNAAAVSIAGDLDPNNNRDTDPTAITGAADATIDKRHTSAFIVGQNGVYTLVVRNIGTASTGAVTVRDTLPAGLSYVSGSGGGWSFSQSGQIITATHAAAVVAGDSSSFTLTVSVAAGAHPSVTNAATVSIAGDLDPSNDRDTDPTAITGVPDASMDKRHTSAFTVGQNATYTLVVRNLGTASTGGVTVRDTLPAGLSYVSGSGSRWSFFPSGQVVIVLHPAPIAAGDSSSCTLTVSVAAGAYPSVTNAATVSITGDLDPNNNRDTDATTITGVPDATIDKRHTSAFTVGQNGVYTLVVTNAGTASSGAVTVRDTLPAGLSYVSGSGGGWSFSQSGQIITATHAAAIVAGDSSSFTLTVSVGAGAFPGVTNAATASTAGDLNPNNDRDTDPTSTGGAPDVTLDKRHTTSFTAGQNASYALVVTNVGTLATGAVTVRDTLPVGLSYVSGSGGGWSFSQSGQIITATHAAAIVAGDSSSYTLTVAVGAAAVPSVVNSATATTAGDVAPNNDRDSDDTAVLGVPDLTIDKRHTSVFSVGVNGVYTIVVTNVGSAETTNTVTVRDTLPAGLTYVSGGGGGWSFGQSGQIVTATYAGSVSVGDSTSFTLNVGVAPGAYPLVTNAATVSMTGDPSAAIDRDVDPTPIAGLHDLVIDKRHTSAFVVGQAGTYRLVITNTGTAATTNTITVTDTLPAGLSFVGGGGAGWSFGQSGQRITATHAGPIAPDDSLVLTLTVAVGATAFPSVTNSATVTTPGDLDTSNDRDSDVTSITGAADVTIDKRHTSVFVVGQNRDYALVVTNAGTAATLNTITVRDTLPSGLTFVSGAGPGWSIGQSGQVITATFAGSLAAGDSASFTLTVAVGAAAYPAVTNSATVSMSGDLDSGNNVDADPTPIAGQHDLTLDKRHTAAFTVGQNATYRLIVTNAGTAATTNTITVTDTLASGLTFVSGAGAGWSFGQNGQRITATHAGPIAAGDSLVLTLTVAVGVAAFPSVTNSATVSTPGDLDAGNDADSDAAIINGVPDASIDKRHTSGFTAGTNGVYTIVVTNAGTAPTSGATTVTDTLPTGLTFVGGAGTGWAFVQNGQEITAIHAVPIPVADSTSFALTVAVGASAVPSVTNSATVSAAGDLDPGNDSDDDVTPVSGQADLTLDKRHNAAFEVGQSATYTIVVTNVGNAATTSAITVADTLASGLTFVSGTGAGWSFGQNGQEITATHPGPIPSGDSLGFDLTVTVGAAAFPSVTNTAFASTAGDPDSGNDDDTDVAGVTGAPDIAMNKRHSPPFVVGQTGVYTLVIVNAGSATAVNPITVRDTLPAGLTYLSVSGVGWSIGQSGQVITATWSDPIAPGDSASFTLTVAIGPAAYPSVTNQATASMTGDVNASNDVDADPTPISGLHDLVIDKRHTSSFKVGLTSVYTFVVTNVGTAGTTNAITVTDTLPPGLTFASGGGAGWGFTQNGQAVTATHAGPIAAGDSLKFTLTADVGQAAFPTVTNSATVATVGDLDPNDDTDSDVAAVIGAPDLAIDKRHTAPFGVNATGTYRIVVTNVGSAVTGNVITVRDTLPAGLTYLSVTGPSWVFSASGRVITGTYGSVLTPGDSTVFTLNVLVDVTAYPSVTNSATLAMNGDADPSNDVDADVTSVTGLHDLTIDKRHTLPFTVGQTGTYTLVVTNTGTAPASNAITVTDTLASGLTFVGGGGAGWSLSQNGQVITATHAGPVAIGDSLSLTLAVAVGVAAFPAVTNSATVMSAGDFDANNNRDSDPTDITGAPDLALDKRHTTGLTVGQNAMWTFVVTNHGTGAATNAIFVTDTLAAGLSFLGISGAGWSAAQNGQEITVSNAGPLAAGDSLSFDLTVAVGAAAFPSVTNRATARTTGETDPSDDGDADVAAVAGAPDLAIDKRHTAPFAVNGTATYVIVVTNVGSAATANPVTVRDTLPAGLTYTGGTGAGWAFSQIGQEITATYAGSIAATDSASFTIDVAVGAAAYPFVSNSATVEVAGDLDAVNDRDTDPTPVAGLFDLVLDKRHTAPFAVAQNGTYAFVVTNTGTTPAPNVVTVTDTLPSGLTFVSGGGAGWSFGQNGQEITAMHAGPIAAGDSLVFTLTVAVGAAAYPSVTNSATVATAGELDLNNDVDTDPTAVVGAPDVTLDKRHTAAFVVGQNGTYTFAVQNAGSAPTAGTTTVVDTLPSGLTFVSGAGAGWSFALNGQEVTATRAAAIAAGDSAVFTLTVSVGQAAYPAVTNAATATTAGESDPNNGRDVDPTQVGGNPDLTLDKRHTLPFTVGQNASYSFTIRNLGTAPTAGTVTLRDTLPAGLTFVAGAGAGWSFSAAGQIVTATRASSIAIGATVTLSMTVSVGAAAYPSVTNTAVVSAPGDLNAANDRDVDPTIVNGSADLSLDKRHVAPFVIGQNATYTLVVTNNGPTVTSGAIVVSDTLPAGLTFVTASGAGWNFGLNSGIVTATHPAVIAAGDSASFTLTVAVGGAAFPAVTNSAQVSGTAGANDPAIGNDYDVDAAVILGQPDLTIDKRHTAAFTAGQNGTYTLVVTNLGTGASAGTITVTDTLASGLTFVSGSGAGWSFSQSGAVVTATSGAAIAAGDSASFALTVSVSPAAVPAVTNSADVSGGGDALASNNRDSDPTPVTGVPDLTLDKRHVVAFAVGQNGVYTLVVRNVGSGATTAATTVTDVLPAGLTFGGGAGTGWSVSATGQTVTATFAGAIAAGDSASVALTVSVGAAAVPSVTNTAQVSGGGDTNGSNDSDSDPTTVGGEPDVALDKRHVNPFAVGQNGDYTFVVTNTGAAPTTGAVVVRDTLPAGLGYVSAVGSGWSFSVSGGIVTASHVGVIVAGDSARFTLTVSVGAAAAPSVMNRATATGGGDVTPPNNTDSDAAQVGGAPDLALDKRHQGTFVVDSPATYTLVVRNVGTAPTSGAVTVRDTLPIGLTFASASGSGWNFTQVGQIVSATFAAPIADGDSAAFTLTVGVADEALPSVTNTATASGGGDLTPVNNFDSDGVTVFGAGQLVVRKTASESDVEIGDVIDYTVTVSNDGEGPVTSGEITDVLPSGFRYLPGSARANGVPTGDPAGSPGPTLRFAVGTLGVSATYRVDYRVAIGAGAEIGTGRNIAFATGQNAGSGPAIASNTAAADVRVRPGALADEGVIFGKLYADCDCDSNRTQGNEELGIPGVRLYLEDGRAAITDAEGKYHFNHVRPLMHIVRIDDATLPQGSRMVPLSTRNGFDGLSRFVDLQKGELYRADFAEGSGASSVFAAIKARRATGETNAAFGDGHEVLAGDATAAPRPWHRASLLAMGLLHGHLNLRSLEDSELGGAGRDRFEDRLLDAVRTRRDGRFEAAGRAALFARARMRDSIQFTVRYDSERDPERRLFSDIRPNEGYDLLGDASVHEFDTQSAGRLFARVDRGRSFAQYGDFATPSSPARLLGAFSRQLNGGLLSVTEGPGMWGAFASQGRQHQVIDELPGQGISGPYALSRPGTLGSERVEILTRDRNQPARIIAIDPQVRFVDYTLEAFTGRLLFRRPVPSIDADLNPVSIRVTYESESAGDKFWVFGASGRVTPNQYLSAGASLSRDDDPLNPLDLVSLDATVTLNKMLSVTAEAARSDSGGDILAGMRVGKAERVEAKLALGRLAATGHALHTDIEFQNPSSGTPSGREELGFGSRLALTPSTALFANGIRTKDLRTLGTRQGLEGGLSQGLGPWLTAEGAYRWAEENTPATPATTGTTPNELSSVRGRLTATMPWRRRTSAYGEFEQDIEQTDKHRFAVGGDVKVTPQTRLFARHENITSFAGPYALNTQQQMATTVVGFASDERDRQVFSEYRMRDAVGGREAQAAMGLRNRWTVMPGLRLDGSLERISILTGPGSQATSVTGGVEYTGSPVWKGTARLEVRRQDKVDRWLSTGGITRKISRDWAALGSTEWLLVPADDRIDARTRFGVAFRETDRNRLSGLARYENRAEHTGDTFRKTAHIAAANGNWQPIARLTFQAQIAAKWARDLHDGFESRTRSSLVSGRTIVELGRWIDAGVAGRARISGTRTYGAGVELGVLLMRDLRVAGGYNVFGFRGEDLLGVDHTDKGPYIDFGFKFGHAAGTPDATSVPVAAPKEGSAP